MRGNGNRVDLGLAVLVFLSKYPATLYLSIAPAKSTRSLGLSLSADLQIRVVRQTFAACLLSIFFACSSSDTRKNPRSIILRKIARTINPGHSLSEPIK